MNKHAAHLFFLLLSLPGASYAMWRELVRNVQPHILRSNVHMVRRMATLSNQQRALYEQRLDQVKSDLQLTQKRFEVYQENPEYTLLPSEINEQTQKILKQQIFELQMKLHEDKVDVNMSRFNGMAY